jgi:hypothetical protein
MLEYLWFYTKVVVFVGLLGLVLMAGRCAHADDLADIGAACMQGNQGACMIYQTAVQQQTAYAAQRQQAVNSLTGWLTQQQILANQRMQPTAPALVFCTQQGVFTVCQ